MPSRLAFCLLFVSAAMFNARGASAAESDSVSVRTGEHAAYSRIVFDWDAPVTSALAQADKNTLVLTFGRAGSFDLSKAPVRKLKRVSGLAPGGDGKSLRITIRGDVTFKMLNYDNTVVVDVISRGSTAAVEPTTNVKKRETIKAKTDTVALDAANLDFRRADSLTPAPSSRAKATAATAVIPFGSEPAAAAPPELTGPLPSPLFDIAAWRGGRDFLTAYREASAELGDAESPESILAMARLQFAWRHGDEGLAMLLRLTELDPALAKRADVAALREALALIAGRPQARGNVFASKTFDGTGESLLWRGAALAADRQWKAAAESFAQGLKALGKYPTEFKAHLALAAAEAGLEAGDAALAQKALEMAENSLTNPADKAQWNALTGLLLMQGGEPDAAEPYLSAAAASEALRPRIMAQLAVIDIGRKSSRLPADKAALELEGLTYIWQGDALQLQILDRLIEAHVSLGRYDRALEAADGAVLAATDMATQRRYRKQIGDLLQSAMAASAAEGGDRLSAIALFDSYGGMLPDAEQRAELGLQLADQLTAADLDDQAADLLRELKRTAPDAQQPAVAAMLAKVEPAAVGTAPAAAEALDTSSASIAVAAADDPAGDPDSLWRDKRWSEAADGYLHRIEGTTGKARPRLILRAAAALMLAGRNSELAALGVNFSGEMQDTALAGPFTQLTAPGADYSLLIAPEMAKALTVTQ
jgi:hypothetical protein